MSKEDIKNLKHSIKQVRLMLRHGVVFNIGNYDDADFFTFKHCCFYCRLIGIECKSKCFYLFECWERMNREI